MSCASVSWAWEKLWSKWEIVELGIRETKETANTKRKKQSLNNTKDK